MENLLPRRWAADDVAVGADGDLIRQLAFGRQVSRDVLVIRSRSLQVLAQTRMRIENQNAFPKFIAKRLIAKRLNRTNLIRISRNQDKTLRVCANGIKDEEGSELIDTANLLLLIQQLMPAYTPVAGTADAPDRCAR